MMQQGGEIEYIQDGLVFHLDGFDFDGNTWVDKVAGVTFTNHGVILQDGLPYFGAKTYLVGNKNIPYGVTYEVAIRQEIENFILFSSITGAINAKTFFLLQWEGANVNKRGWGNNGYAAFVTPDTINTLSFCGNFVIYDIHNKSSEVLALDNVSVHVTNGSPYVGMRKNVTGVGYFVGVIYSIRIYNRVLQENEMIHNQQVDNLRFNLGL